MQAKLGALIGVDQTSMKDRKDPTLISVKTAFSAPFRARIQVQLQQDRAANKTQTTNRPVNQAASLNVWMNGESVGEWMHGAPALLVFATIPKAGHLERPGAFAFTTHHSRSRVANSSGERLRQPATRQPADPPASPNSGFRRDPPTPSTCWKRLAETASERFNCSPEKPHRQNGIVSTGTALATADIARAQLL